MKTAKTDIRIRGMICQSCVQEVEDALIQTRGVLSAKVSYVRASAHIAYDPALTSVSALEERLRALGYAPGERTRRERLADLLCLAAAALLTLLLASQKRYGLETQTAGALGAFLLGLSASPHCIGMCGGILLGSVTGSGRQAQAALGYNLGRVLSYSAGGALFGALGTVLSYTQSTKSMILTMLGLLVLVLGLNMWGLVPGLRALFPERRGACSLPASLRARTLSRPLLVGLLTALMPCGTLYTMWMLAASSGSAASGALLLLCFAAGTVPLLGVFGSLGALVPKRWNKLIFKLSAVLVSAMGFHLLLSGLRLLH